MKLYRQSEVLLSILRSLNKGDSGSSHERVDIAKKQLKQLKDLNFTFINDLEIPDND